MEVYTAKTLYKITVDGTPKGKDAEYIENCTLFEERVVLISAKDFDEAISSAEDEAREYAIHYTHTNPYGEQVKCTFLGCTDVFCLEQKVSLQNLTELYSSTCVYLGDGPSPEEFEIYRFGPSYPDDLERAMRLKFQNIQFSRSRF